MEGIITSSFGARINPVLQKEEFHDGIDIAVPIDTEIIAVKDGICIEKGFSDTFGNYLKYKTTDNYIIMYAHLNEVKTNVGDEFTRSKVIALSGNTGLATGPHLHYTIWKDDELIDPLQYLTLPITEEAKLEIVQRVSMTLSYFIYTLFP